MSLRKESEVTMPGEDYTQMRNAAAAEAVDMGNILRELQMAEVGMYRELSTENDPIRIQQLMEELKDIQKATKQAQKPQTQEAAPPAEAPPMEAPPAEMAPEMAPEMAAAPPMPIE